MTQHNSNNNVIKYLASRYYLIYTLVIRNECFSRSFRIFFRVKGMIHLLCRFSGQTTGLAARPASRTAREMPTYVSASTGN